MLMRVKKRRRGFTRISSKHQATIPVDVMREAGLEPGDELRAKATGPGKVVLERVDETDAIAALAGLGDGLYEPGYLEKLRAEWER
jgi:bifunctional DNA-binding transcriptional regulator/antitoxin component of YhaV-PrlF toxin-antitoxin module